LEFVEPVMVKLPPDRVTSACLSDGFHVELSFQFVNPAGVPAGLLFSVNVAVLPLEAI